MLLNVYVCSLFLLFENIVKILFKIDKKMMIMFVDDWYLICNRMLEFL